MKAEVEGVVAWGKPSSEAVGRGRKDISLGDAEVDYRESDSDYTSDLDKPMIRPLFTMTESNMYRIENNEVTIGLTEICHQQRNHGN